MRVRLAAALATGAILASAQPALAASSLEGEVLAAGKGVKGSTVSLYAAGAGAPALLAKDATDSKGEFQLSYDNPSGDAVLYAVADGGATKGKRPNRALRMISVAGLASGPLTELAITEQTTVASGYALSRFLHGAKLRGPSPGLQNAAATVSNLVEPRTGKVSFVLANSPNGEATEALPTFNTLANVLAYCTTGGRRQCGRLFELTRPPRGAKPHDTLAAVVDLAHHPTRRHTAPLLSLQPRKRAYEPALEFPPVAWTIALVYTDGGFDAPGRMAFDSAGRIWVTNNFESPGTVAGRGVTVLSPTGQPILHSPISGGGVLGAGFGVAVDQADRAWIGNYAGSTVSLFDPAGNPLSPPGGWSDGGISKAQGLAIDQQGSVWIPNFGGDSVTVYRGGNPSAFETITGGGLAKPFGLAIDARGNAWVTDYSTSLERGAVTKIRPDGTPSPNSPIVGGGLRSPQGIAVDSGGNLWVANLASKSVTEIANSGRVYPRSPIDVPSLTGPWGIAVDGDDNVWVAGFLEPSLTQLCGRQQANCPAGKRTGDPISPSQTGFQSAALQHLTAVQVDQSGNVWLANNWSTGSSLGDFVGGNGLVEFIGLAAPVKTPLIGPPQSP